ncbi:hypothetical protein CIW48_26955 [Methylobacterium sp. P1-11]|uniref:DUF7352 domain-containing protein n=1 Tax=Methylobacterium sp. P1-11 TaxID=2024616 RepID=UPI0011F08D8C|nr:hypothetical protein [Methylobacterium sp. P1-11]KAA0117846.1 hypothetical protein CIW48_26955 [Methylobacterium sp. P1-11]
MAQIWKFDVKPSLEPITFKAPGLGKALFFGLQDHQARVWMKIKPGHPEVERRIQVVGTGHDIPENWRYVGSVQDGPYVWHCFQEGM